MFEYNASRTNHQMQQLLARYADIDYGQLLLLAIGYGYPSILISLEMPQIFAFRTLITNTFQDYLKQQKLFVPVKDRASKDNDHNVEFAMDTKMLADQISLQLSLPDAVIRKYCDLLCYVHAPEKSYYMSIGFPLLIQLFEEDCTRWTSCLPKGVVHMFCEYVGVV